MTIATQAEQSPSVLPPVKKQARGKKAGQMPAHATFEQCARIQAARTMADYEDGEQDLLTWIVEHGGTHVDAVNALRGKPAAWERPERIEPEHWLDWVELLEALVEALATMGTQRETAIVIAACLLEELPWNANALEKTHGIGHREARRAIYNLEAIVSELVFS